MSPTGRASSARCTDAYRGSRDSTSLARPNSSPRAPGGEDLRTASRSTIHEWAGAGGEHVHVQEFSFAADHPTLGNGHGPTPQEYVLHALAACITGGAVTTAAARKVEITSIESTVQGFIDVRGVLGVSDQVRKGFSEIRMDIKIAGDAPAEKLREIVESGREYSAVYDMLTGETPVSINVTA